MVDSRDDTTRVDSVVDGFNGFNLAVGGFDGLDEASLP